MKRIFNRFREKTSFKELPPPYCVNENAVSVQEHHQDIYNQINPPACEVVDLLANCRITSKADVEQESDADYAEIKEMGLWHSTPLAHRHKSKISLTWVLKENLESTKLPTAKLDTEKTIRNKNGRDKDRPTDQTNQRYNKINENVRQRKSKSGEVRDRVVGRNEYYHNLRFKSAFEEFMNGQGSYSDDTSGDTEEYVKKKHRHRHRRKKKSQLGKFGYDIRDLDSFLSEATIDRPGNIPVVIAYPSTLYQTQKDLQRELNLPLGTVVNAVFKNEQWLYVQTPHGDEGYVIYSACLPLGILPNRNSTQKKTPCWESSTDLYPRPCGNLTDNEKEQLRGRTRSECRYPARNRRKLKNSCAERDFDNLYLKTKSVCSNIDRLHENDKLREFKTVKRHTLLVVNSDYKGSVLNKTLTVHQGDVVILVQEEGVEADVDSEWFYVRKKDGSQGFIPASIAGHGYI